MNIFNLVGIPEGLISSLPSEVIFIVPHGSRLYGTNSEDSDEDVVAIFIPSSYNLALQVKEDWPKLRFNKDGTKQDGSVQNPSNKDTIEVEFMSLPDLVKGFISGSPMEMEIMSYLKGQSDLRSLASGKRSEMEPKRFKANLVLDFLSGLGEAVVASDVHPLLGFAKKNITFIQEKANRYKTFTELQAWIKDGYVSGRFEPHDTISERKEGRENRILELVELSKRLPGIELGDSGWKLFQKTVSYDITFSNLYRHLETILGKYSERTVTAYEVGFDLKGLYHAVRCVIQVKEILLRGSITYPLREADLLKQVKAGEVEVGKVQDLLVTRFNEVRSLMEDIPHLGSRMGEGRRAAEYYICNTMLDLYRSLYRN